MAVLAPLISAREISELYNGTTMESTPTKTNNKTSTQKI